MRGSAIAKSRRADRRTDGQGGRETVSAPHSVHDVGLLLKLLLRKFCPFYGTQTYEPSLREFDIGPHPQVVQLILDPHILFILLLI